MRRTNFPLPSAMTATVRVPPPSIPRNKSPDDRFIFRAIAWIISHNPPFSNLQFVTRVSRLVVTI